ncbi:MAG: hypothetical protein U9R54_09150 [Bacteroidota bacterium]|nr:hypothetical protein [Bacteroidota bacterium]
MEKSELIKYINNPELLNNDSLKFIEGILDEFPYFQTAHLLYLKNLKNINSPNFEKYLHYSSAFIHDRNMLFELLNFIDNSKLQISKSIVKDGNVKSQEESNEKKLKEDTSKKDKKNSEGLEKETLHKNVRRRIKPGFEGMADNISDTLSRQLNHYSSRKDEDLQYSPELFSLEENEKREEKNDDILFIDDNVDNDVDPVEIISENNEENESDDNTELLEFDNNQNKEKKETNDFFDINNYSEVEIPNQEKTKENKLIEKFVENDPRLETNKDDVDTDENVDLSKDSLNEEDDLLSETLIKVYIKQKYFDKAISAYKKLSLKYPKKNTYFANQIKIITELKNKQKNK